MNEVWKPVMDGYYSVSNLGNVRREVSGKGSRSGKHLVQSIDSVGYIVVTPCINGEKRVVRVHCLVACAFIGDRPDGMHINHIDGNKQNNMVSNLEYVTQAENMAHAGRIGLIQSGENHWIRRRRSAA